LSQESNVKLREIAEDIVRKHESTGTHLHAVKEPGPA
jgi:hypothetical protein